MFGLKRAGKRITAAVLTSTVLLSVCSCDGNLTGQKTGTFHQWIDSNLFETVDEFADADLKDDFAAAVNYEWATMQERDFSYAIAAFGEAQRNVAENKRAMINDESYQNKNIELVRIADGLFCDWDYRESLGVEPLKKYLSYIDEIQSIDDVSKYMIDNDKNPFAFSLVELGYDRNEALEDYMALTISMPGLTLENAEYYVFITDDGYKKKETVKTVVCYLLERCGYSQKESEKIFNNGLSFESKIVDLGYSERPDYTAITTRSEIIEMAGAYPLEEMLEHYSIDSCNNFMGSVKYLDSLEKIYKQNNVDDMKDYFKVRLAYESARYLDAGAYDSYQDSKLDRSNPYTERIDKDPDFNFFSLINQTSLTAAMDQAYLDYYFDENTYNEICGFIKLLKEKYEILINSNENLSEESKKAICAKLDAMGENVIRPSNTADFTGVELKSKEEGGTYLDALCVLNRVKYEHFGDVVQAKCDRTFWDIYDPMTSTTIVNASYYPPQNSIFIYMGILTEPMYSPDDPIEKKLGSFVAVLGHEISHAFDTTGINYDATGKAAEIVTKDEMQFWTKAAMQISDDFCTIEPFEDSGKYDNQPDVSGEVIADAEGVRVCLMIAKDYEDFDYDTFFRGYAEFWRRLLSKSEQMDLIDNNEHPLPYLRINYTLMQFDEFIETYDIKPGDGMYLEPEKRIIIW